jgi:hypothetical protein
MFIHGASLSSFLKVGIGQSISAQFTSLLDPILEHPQDTAKMDSQRHLPLVAGSITQAQHGR